MNNNASVAPEGPNALCIIKKINFLCVIGLSVSSPPGFDTWRLKLYEVMTHQIVSCSLLE